MGDRFIALPARQRPDLTETKPHAASVDVSGASDPAIRVVVLALLAVDGVLSALAGALLLPSYIGAIPVPLSALVSGLVNAALVWAAARWTRSTRVAALPLFTWLLTVAVLSLGGPGGDVILDLYRLALLLLLGLTPPVWVLLRTSHRR